ncbi:hypothetical protein IAI10_14260 [Clostridium sp. 19966]|uniref:hypothetical protein n=1 Tax=Clostridium sp. 19966 TaxID=2768166 RepID=UPI0028DE37E9|nr:hypothetical protein [Clostridium sp. 19966]MDT8717828.1 hypothetical protein [Clostridium sp. 19966]
MAASSSVKANGYLRGVSTYQILNDDTYTNIGQYRYDSTYLYFLKGIIFNAKVLTAANDSAQYTCALTVPLVSHINSLGKLAAELIVEKYAGSIINTKADMEGNVINRNLLNLIVKSSFSVAANSILLKNLNSDIKGSIKTEASYTNLLEVPLLSHINSLGKLAAESIVEKYADSIINTKADMEGNVINRNLLNLIVKSSFSITAACILLKNLNSDIKSGSKIAASYTIDKILFENMNVGSVSYVKANYWRKLCVYMISKINASAKINVKSQLLIQTKKTEEATFKLDNVFEEQLQFKNIDFTCIWHNYNQLSQYIYNDLNIMKYKNITSTFISLEERVMI